MRDSTRRRRNTGPRRRGHTAAIVASLALGAGCGTQHEAPTARLEQALFAPPTWGAGCPYPANPVFGATNGDTYYYFDCAGAPGGLAFNNAARAFGTGLEPSAGTMAGVNYTYRGFVDVTVPRASINHKVISLDARRINAIPDGAFGVPGACATPSTASGDKYHMRWYDPCGISAVDTGTDCEMDLGYTACGADHQSIEQAFGASAGDLFTVTLDYDGSALSATEPYPNSDFQKLNVTLRHQNWDPSTGMGLDNLKVFWPSSNLLTPVASKLTTLTQFDRTHLTGTQAFRFRVAADEIDTAYPGVTFDQCTSGGAECAANPITHASLQFSVSDDGGLGGHAVIDDVFVDLENQVEVEILAPGSPSPVTLQRSTLDKGFYVDVPPAPGDVIVRLHMRSYSDDRYPTIRALRVSPALDLDFTRGTQVKAMTNDRIGINGAWEPPASEVIDATRTDLRSECRDSSTSASENCFDYFVHRNVAHRKFFFATSWLDATWDATSGSYVLSLNADGEHYAQDRIARPRALYGHDGIMLLVNDGTIGLCSGGTCTQTALDAVPSTTPEALVAQYAGFVAELFDGTQTYSCTAGTCSYPLFDTFELFGEVNGTAAGDVSWGTPDRHDMADLANQVAAAILAKQPGANVTTPGIHGGNPSRIFDAPFLDAILDTAAAHFWDSTLFGGRSFHPYIGTNRPEDQQTRWNTAWSAFTGWGWAATAPVYFPEFGLTHQVYDPYCQPSATHPGQLERVGTLSNGTWSRGWGEEELTRLYTRDLLAKLSLPTTVIYPYGVFTPEVEYIDHDCLTTGVCYDCWQADPETSFQLFDRVAGSGILSGVDAPTMYEPNEAGRAFMTVAREIADSSPWSSTVQLPESYSRSDNEHYYSAFFDVGGNTRILALWWFHDYLFGARWMDYLSGVEDDGFAALRVHDVTLHAMGGAVTSAQIIPLDGGAPLPAVVDNSTGTPILRGLILGERPTLIKLTVGGT